MTNETALGFNVVVEIRVALGQRRRDLINSWFEATETTRTNWAERIQQNIDAEIAIAGRSF